MPATPNKININFARNNYNVFGQRPSADQADQQQEQKTELLEGKNGPKKTILFITSSQTEKDVFI